MIQDMTLLKDIILEAAEKARAEIPDHDEKAENKYTQSVDWPVKCTVGPGLEGAIACESKIGYVNGSKGWLIYRGFNIFDLAANCTYEEVCYLLLHGNLPNQQELEEFKTHLASYRYLNQTLRMVMNFPIETMNAMAALRMGTNLMRQEFTFLDRESGKPGLDSAIGADEDSIPMETIPQGFPSAVYEFEHYQRVNQNQDEATLEDASSIEAAYHLIAGVSTLTAAISRIRRGRMPVEPDPTLGHAANLLYMMTGRKPTPLEERVMDISLILHADHGMNASTFAAMVVASTLSDVYFSVGSGIAALNGPLHGGANEKVLYTLQEIGREDQVKPWLKEKLANKEKIMGFGHRVYKAYDPRARILSPLAEILVRNNPEAEALFKVASTLETEMVGRVGETKKIFPNVDFYSGLVYGSLGIDPSMFTSIFAVSRVAGWTARVLEYLQRNRIFRPRAIYVGELHEKVQPIEDR